MTPLDGARSVLPAWPSAATPVRRALVLGVVGGRGGAGASTLAASVARHLARRTATVLVDLDRASGGIDVLLGLESADGVRWPDLADARGDVPGADVLALLPRWGACAVLSADRDRPGAPEPAVVADVLHALTLEAGALVLDLDRAATVAGESVAAVCDAVLVVAPRDLRTVAGILALRPRLDGVPAWLVARGPAPGGLGAAELSSAAGLPVLATLPTDRGLPSALERGALPRRGRTSRAVVRLVGALERELGR
ncbi:MAG: septum site-determining protein Ssd [Cellulomonas sp.]